MTEGILHVDRVEKADGSPVTMTGQRAPNSVLHYDQTAPQINASLNLSSVTDQGAGDFQINLTNVYTDTFYRFTGTASSSAGNTYMCCPNTFGSHSKGTGGTDVYTANQSATFQDCQEISCVLEGDLA